MSNLNDFHRLGNRYLLQNQLDNAEEAYLSALAINPEHSDTLSNLGVVYLKQNQPQIAINYFTQALAFQIDHEEARNNLAAIFMQYDRYENAARHYRELLSQHPDNPEYHYNIGVAYMQLGHLDEAITHFSQVLRMNKAHTASLNNLAAIYWRLDNKKKAKNYWQRALASDPNDTASQYMLSAANHQTDAYTAAPKNYIKNLFDNYAINYDRHLCQELQYQLPGEIKRVLENPPYASLCKGEDHSAWMTLDLGCGTGLVGNILKPYSSTLWGVDLSEKMLAIAEQKNCYDQLFCDDITDFFQHLNHTGFHCICAAEVLEYSGDLDALFTAISSCLLPEGLFLFSIEPNTQSTENYILQETARFAHHPNYIQALAKTHGFSILQQIPLSARLQHHAPLPTYLFVLWKQ